jgi:ParB family chromosome partitioning protein
MQESGSDMDWETFDIDLNDIDVNNSTYRITTDQTIEPLIVSIGAIGLLNPPFIFPAAHRKYMVISGFKRVAACRHLGYASIRTHLLNPDITPDRLAELAICDNASQRPLNLVESSRALTLLAGYVQDPAALEQINERLGLPEHAAMRDKVMRLCRMPDTIQAGVLQEAISLKTALMLDDLGAENGVMLAEIFRDLHLSHSKQREILIHIDDIARRDGINTSALLNNAQLQALLSDPNTNHVQKAARVRQFIRSKRYPVLTHTEETFQKESKKLSLGHNIRFSAPSSFESREYVFTMGVKSLKDLESGIKNLQKTLNNPALQKILTLTTT